jgi:hypothetical protein
MPIKRDKKRYSFGYSTCLQRDKFIKLFKETQESLLADCEFRLFNRKWEPPLLKKPMTEKEHDYLPEWYEKPREVDWMDLAEDDKGFVFRIRQLYSLEKRFEEIFGFVMLTGLDTADHIWSYKKRMKEKEFDYLPPSGKFLLCTLRLVELILYELEFPEDDGTIEIPS